MTAGAALYRSIHDGARPRRTAIDWPPERPRYAVSLGRTHAIEYWLRTPRGLELTRHEVQGYDHAPELLALDHGRRGRSLAFRGGAYTIGARGIEEVPSMKRRRTFGSGSRIVRYNAPLFGSGPEARVISDGLIVGATAWGSSTIASAMLERTNWSRSQKAAGVAAVGFLGGFLLARRYPRLALGFIVLGFVELGRMLAGAVRVNAWSRQLASVGGAQQAGQQAGQGTQPQGTTPPADTTSPPRTTGNVPPGLPDPARNTYGGWAFNPWAAHAQQQRAAA